MNKALVVHGQGMNLVHSGGAGRYGLQIYKRLLVSRWQEDVTEPDLYLAGFEEISHLEKRGKPWPNRAGDWLKYAAFRSLPPIIFENLQKKYNRSKHAAADGVSATGTHHSMSSSWSKLSSKTVLHELTNYHAHREMGRMSLSPNLLLMVTFLDIQDFFYPEYFSDKALKQRRLMYSFYKDQAELFLTISQFTKQSMVERLGIPSEKIRVIHLAADDIKRLSVTQKDVEWVNSFGRYWIYPAKAWKHKNHDFLLKSLGKRSKELVKAGVKLLLTGGFGDEEISRLENLAQHHSLENVVEILGFVTDEKLQALMSGAEFLVFPSLFEGFGMPVLEAMTLGCPVLSSNAGALPEIGGDAPLYFDPHSDDEFITLIDAVLAERGVDREDMIQRGLKNCKQFSWDQTVNDTFAVYEELLS